MIFVLNVTPLLIAVYNENIEAVDLLLKYSKIDIDFIGILIINFFNSVNNLVF